MHHGRQRADAHTAVFLVYRIRETSDEKKKRTQALHITFVVEGDTVELLKGIVEFAVRSREARVHWNTLHLSRIGAANIYASALLDIAEVHRIGADTTLVGDHRWLHVTNECPLGLSEEGVSLDVRGTSAGS